MGEWRVEGFTEVRELGRGAQGRVVLARHDDAGTPVAIKYLTGASADLDRLRDEAVLLGRVEDPHVARLYRFVTGPDGAAIVMEAVDGVPLRRVLAEHGALGPEAALVVLKGSLLGLAAAHAVGVVHRDYKPANVVVRGDGLSKLIDFGIAAPAGADGASGTPAYMPPEQWAGRPAGPAADVYAATCVFFECVTGRKPFAAPGADGLRAAHLTAPIPVADAPPELGELLLAGMAKDPAHRPAGALALLAELERVAGAGYGADWEDRGVRLLASAAAALAALFPLAVAGLGTALGAGAGGAAGGGVAGAAGGAAGGGGAGLLAGTGAKVAVAVVAAVAVAGGGAAAYTARGSGGHDAPPAKGASPAVALAAMTTTEQHLAVNAKYARVTGLADAGAQEKVNAALRAPLDFHISWMRQANKSMLVQPETRAECGTAAVDTSVKLGLSGPRLVSALYTFDGRTCAPSDGTLPGWAVNADLKTGRPLTTADILKPSALTDAGIADLFRRLTSTEEGVFGPDGCAATRLKRADFLPGPASGDDPAGIPAAATVFLDRDHFAVNWSVEGSACIHDVLTAPYAKVRDLLNPDIAAALPA
ncbi:protein kinase domain-containing protein [Actinomadura atramentaria]|uniref:protein kinase domain-containing protein n=1 Tax=Actinomadura atramentaria TaxID=1990 RepID=UPI0003A4E891|nr:serine/threonine-protein kinase [Actinomadura atramentaria]